jgi:hypothetical protein
VSPATRQTAQASELTPGLHTDPCVGPEEFQGRPLANGAVSDAVDTPRAGDTGRGGAASRRVDIGRLRARHGLGASWPNSYLSELGDVLDDLTGDDGLYASLPTCEFDDFYLSL